MREIFILALSACVLSAVLCAVLIPVLKKAVIAAVLAAVILPVVFLYQALRPDDEYTEADFGIQAVYLEQQDLSASIHASGQVESASVVEVTTEVTSRVVQLNVALGDHVKRGDVLCVLDDSEITETVSPYIMARIIDIKSDIERSGELSPDDKNRILDTKIECEEIAWELGKILLEVQVDEAAKGGIRRSENHL